MHHRLLRFYGSCVTRLNSGCWWKNWDGTESAGCLFSHVGHDGKFSASDASSLLKRLFVSNKGLNQQRQTCGPKNKSALDGFLKSVNKSRKVINNSNFITKCAGSIDVGSLVLLNSSENTCTLKKNNFQM